MIQAKSIIRIGKKIDSLSFSQVENKKKRKSCKRKNKHTSEMRIMKEKKK